MHFFSAMDIVASGLNAQRTRLNIIASNLANARTTRTPEGGPYQRRDPVFEAAPVSSRFRELLNDPAAQATYTVNVAEVRADTGPPTRLYDPTHPDADAEGFVSLPNVNVMEEMVNLLTAQRAYDAGITVMQSVKGMARAALSIGA